MTQTAAMSPSPPTTITTHPRSDYEEEQIKFSTMPPP